MYIRFFLTTKAQKFTHQVHKGEKSDECFLRAANVKICGVKEIVITFEVFKRSLRKSLLSKMIFLFQKITSMFSNKASIIYSDTSNKQYSLIDSFDTHQHILFRKGKSQTIPNDFNIDIMFKGVMSMNIVPLYKGITISVVGKKRGQTCRSTKGLNHIFQITDNTGVISFIEGAAFFIFHNQLPYNQSSIGDFSLENKQVYSSNTDVAAFSKSKGFNVPF